VKVFWEKKYKMPGRETAAQPCETQYYHTDCKANPLAEFISLPGFYNAQSVAVAYDEYKEYLRISVEHCNKLLEWWKAYEGQFSILLQIVLDLFSIPFMSAECK
jgi:hypothetical protein